ncbi:MAG TPA: hypothetical protein VNB24_09820 [Acidimicrobiales bacterium]|nr:hypothetical protein [Acidimicrobiales bacterium]
MVLAVSQSVALLLLFVVLPLVLAYVIARLVQWRSEPFPAELRTSTILRDGDSAEGELIDWRSPAQSFLDRHPMVTFRVAVAGREQYEIRITQSVPRGVLRHLERGMTVPIRLSADRTHGAIVFHEKLTDG